MAWSGLSDNGKAVLLALIPVIGTLGTLWIQSHNQHSDKMEIEAEKVKALQSIDKQLGERKPLVFTPGKEP